MLGDNRDNSLDSRQFGFVPLSDVVARVRQVYFSLGKDGIQWERIGTIVGG
jgi:signal peptidase I